MHSLSHTRISFNFFLSVMAVKLVIDQVLEKLLIDPFPALDESSR
jgi:hypothetical protein